jgi:hypothetical protein
MMTARHMAIIFFRFFIAVFTVLSKLKIELWIFVHTRMDENEKARGRSLDL